MDTQTPTWLPGALTAVRDRTAVVAVVGCGYVGLTVALGCARAGMRVLGVEADEERAKALARGHNPVPDVHVDDEELVRLRDDGLLTFTTTLDEPADVHVICVPTPLRDGSPDVRHVEEAGAAVGEVLADGNLVVLESTTYPGTTEELLRPILEQASGLSAGTDFGLANSPERIDPGNLTWGLENTPKVVGGLTPACTELAVAFYEQLCEAVVPVASPRAAEITKLYENTYREVNIALANEMAVVCHDFDIDPWEVLQAAASKPFGFTPFRPGPGRGGHCLLPGERVAVRDEAGVHVLTVEELWERASGAASPERTGDFEVLRADGLSIAALEDDAGSWDRLGALGRSGYDGPAITVTTGGGRSIRVTADHRMLVHEDGALRSRRAHELREGDLVPIWRGSEFWDAVLNPRADLLDDPTWAEGLDVGVRLAVGDWRPFKDAIRREIGASRADDAVRAKGGRIPLATYLTLEARGEIRDISHEDLILCTGQGRSARRFPAVVEITPDIARLVGYYLAEGCITGSKHPRVVFAFHRDETETKADLCKILGTLGIEPSVWEDPNFLTTQLKVGNRPFLALLERLGCGHNSYDARIPAVLLGSSAIHRRELLTGLLRGDGHAKTSSKMQRYRKGEREYVHRRHAAEIGYWSVSERLAEEVEHLLLSLGYVPDLYRRAHQKGLMLSVNGSQDLAWLAELFCDAKGERLQRHLSERRRPNRASRAWKRSGELHLTPVKRVEVGHFRGPVYSFEVEPSHVFAATHGILVGNCIGVDPQYLAWRVRGKVGHQFRLVETAHDVNQRMPAFVAQRAAEILNEEGKAVKGAAVLLLGMAYKGGSADTRESPAIKVAERLIRSGAKIAYHDPYVPTVELEGETHESVELSTGFVGWADLVVILTDHPEIDYETLADQARCLYDTRGVTWSLDLPPGARVHRA